MLTYSSLMSTMDHLKCEGLIKPLPYTTYHASEIDKALMTLGKGAHVGKIVISYDHDSDLGIKVCRYPSKHFPGLLLTLA